MSTEKILSSFQCDLAPNKYGGLTAARAVTVFGLLLTQACSNPIIAQAPVQPAIVEPAEIYPNFLPPAATIQNSFDMSRKKDKLEELKRKCLGLLAGLERIVPDLKHITQKDLDNKPSVIALLNALKYVCSDVIDVTVNDDNSISAQPK